MNSFYPITEVKARQILDSRGNPTIEAEVKAIGVHPPDCTGI